jgi:predicted DsbA family dithiol-disulfide isomerase
MEKNTLTIPIAIIVAGALIGGAVILSNRGAANNPNLIANNVGNNPNVVAAEPLDLNLNTVDMNDHIIGNPNAPVVVVEYSDTECPFCKMFHGTMHKLTDQYATSGNMAWVYRHFPLETLHAYAKNEAAATECVALLGGNDKFWVFTDSIYETTTSNDGLDPAQLPILAEKAGVDRGAFEACLDSGKTIADVDRDMADAQQLGARGTPYTVLVLQKEASQELQDFVASQNASILAQQRPGSGDIMAVSKDKKKIFVSGAMPYEILTAIVDLAIK